VASRPNQTLTGYDNNDYIFTAPSDGLYEFSVQATVALGLYDGITAQNVWIYGSVNGSGSIQWGSARVREDSDTTNTREEALSYSFVTSLSTNDTVELKLDSSGTNTNTWSLEGFLEIKKLP
jgi:hypothetical protein